MDKTNYVIGLDNGKYVSGLEYDASFLSKRDINCVHLCSELDEAYLFKFKDIDMMKKATECCGGTIYKLVLEEFKEQKNTYTFELEAYKEISIESESLEEAQRIAENAFQKECLEKGFFGTVTHTEVGDSC